MLLIKEKKRLEEIVLNHELYKNTINELNKTKEELNELKSIVPKELINILKKEKEWKNDKKFDKIE